MQGLFEHSKLVIKQDIQIPSYQKMVEETEQKHATILKILQTIQIKDIQDIFYILKPTQQLYNSICGLLCFMAGVDKAITTDYLFLQQRDWVASQSLFCKNYESISLILSNIQQHSLKKRINITNVKEAMKFDVEEQKIELITIADKLQKVLQLSLSYYNSFYKIMKFNQKYQQHAKIPQKQDEIKEYMLGKIKNFDQEESDEQAEGETQDLIMHPTPQDVHTPLKMLNQFKDFDSYQKGVTTSNPKVQVSTSKNHYFLSKSPKPRIQSEKLNLTNEYMSFQDQISVKTFQTQPNEPEKSKPKQQKQYSQRSTVKQNSIIKDPPTFNSPDLHSLVEKIQKNEIGIERQIQNEIENVIKQVKKLEAVKKQLAWEDERQSKKSKGQQEQRCQSDAVEYNKVFLEKKQQFLKEQQKEKTRFEKIVPQKVEETDYKKQRVQSLYRELVKCVKAKESLEKEADWMKEQIYVKSSGIQKY